MSDGPSWMSGFKEDYEKVFVEDWSPYFGIILLLIVIFGLMASGLFWGVFGGLKLWGDWINHFIGLGQVLGVEDHLESPLTYRMSLMDITLVLGACASALMAKRFSINRPPPLEYVWAAFGGTLMGIGATLAGGCTTGGFFTPLLHSSPAGWAMWVGLLMGAFIGLKALLWTLENITWGMTSPPVIRPSESVLRLYPWIGVAMIVLILVWAANWYASDDNRLAVRAIIVLAGFAIGFVMNRSRLCFARAFREPFMTAEGDMTKAMIIGLAIGIPVASLMFQAKIIDPYLPIPPRFWLGSLLGGLIFGVGMVFAGGCASGSLWRMGEGHIKLWVAVFFFSWVGSTCSALLKQAGILTSEMNLDLVEETRMGYQAFLPVMLDGWFWAYVVSGGILLLWYILVRYNESTEKFTVL